MALQRKKILQVNIKIVNVFLKWKENHILKSEVYVLMNKNKKKQKQKQKGGLLPRSLIASVASNVIPALIGKGIRRKKRKNCRKKCQ